MLGQLRLSSPDLNVSQVEPETCGHIRRLIEESDGAAAELHHVAIDNARLHYHAQTDELYYIIDGQGTMILDNEQIEVHKGMVSRPPRRQTQGRRQADGPDGLYAAGRK
jgi:mannose-6-phosphate isomerase-like protein (cupin superfamily)